MASKVVIVYKEVGKNPEFKKVNCTIKEFKSLVGGDFTIVKYDSFVIAYRVKQERLLPNIYLNTSQLGIDKTLRGNIFAINYNFEKNEFTTLDKKQAFKAREVFIKEAYDYSNFDENGNYVDKRKNKDKNQNVNIGSNMIFQNNIPAIQTKSNAKLNSIPLENIFTNPLIRIPQIKVIKTSENKVNDVPKIDENKNLEEKNKDIEKITSLEQLNSILNSNLDSKDNLENVKKTINKEETIKLILMIQKSIISWIKQIND